MRANPALSSHAKLAQRCSTPTRKIGARTIGHLLNADDGPQPQLDTIVAVAEAFKLPPWMLLHPEFDASTRRIDELDAEVIDIARRISVMSKGHLPEEPSPREPLARVKDLHEPRPPDYRAKRRTK